jgi:hypothetical protein
MLSLTVRQSLNNCGSDRNSSGSCPEHSALAHGKSDPLSLNVYFDNANVNVLSDFDNLPRVFYKPISELTDMDKSILLDTDIGKGPKPSDISDFSRQPHAFYEVVHGVDSFGKMKWCKNSTRIPTGFSQLLHDISEGWQTG